MFGNVLLDSAVALQPDDDSKYLVYADWLEEQGRARDAQALRVLGGVFDDSPTGRDASRLALHLVEWLSPTPYGHDWAELAPNLPGRAPDDVRAARSLKGFLSTFARLWGQASPYVVDDTLVDALTNSPIDEGLKVPDGARLTDVSFARVPVGQNGPIGLDGGRLNVPCDVTTAFDLLASFMEGVELDEVGGARRAEVFDGADGWVAGSVALAWEFLVLQFANNEGRGLRVGRKTAAPEFTLAQVVDDLGPVRGAVFTHTELNWVLLRFEKGWLLFHVTL